MSDPGSRPRIVLIAGEHSGDLLGARLMVALKAMHEGEISYSGVGGDLMEAQGLRSLFPLSDVAVMGPLAILKRLPTLYNRVHQAVDASVAFNPDVVVIIDSPEFTHPIAKRIRKKLPATPIIDYVSPSVWAWRPGRARRMTRYIDHVLALLPFEPDAHVRLGGPDCSYVGHSLAEKLDDIRSLDLTALSNRLGLQTDQVTLSILPGSRPSEVSKLLQVFGDSVKLLTDRIGPFNIILPTVSSVRHMVEEGVRDWHGSVHIVESEEDKFAGFRLSDAALAASGTVTLELAAAGTPMVVAYKVDPLAARLGWLVKVPSFVLPNLIIGRNAIPEYMQDDCTPENLCDALFDLIKNEKIRNEQISALDEARARLALDQGTPSGRAAEIVLHYLGK